MITKATSIQGYLNEIRALTMVLVAVSSGLSARGEGNGEGCWPIDVDEAGEREWLELGVATVYREIDGRCEAIEGIASNMRVLDREPTQKGGRR